MLDDSLLVGDLPQSVDVHLSWQFDVDRPSLRVRLVIVVRVDFLYFAHFFKVIAL